MAKYFMLFPPLWSFALQAASFNGIPFNVLDSNIMRSRNVAVHQYPYSDLPYVEDLGRGLQQIPFRGFLVGDDVYAQRDKLAAACDQQGLGTLVHPSLGKVQAKCVSASFGEKADSGRMIEIDMHFIIAAPIQFPSLLPKQGTNSLTPNNSGFLDTVVGGIKDFANKVTTFISDATSQIQAFIAPITGAISGVLTAIAPFSGLIMGAVGVAFASISAIRGQAFGAPDTTLGRYAQGNLQSASSSSTAPQATATQLSDAATTAITNGCVARANVVSALATAKTLASNGDSNFPQAIADIIELTRTSINDPSDQITALLALAAFSAPQTINSTSTIGAAIANATIATAALVRRMALASIANSCSLYQPTSSTQTSDLISVLAPLYDNEITFSADNGDLNSYTSLRALRANVISDLQRRGSQLPPIMTIKLAKSLPSLVVAQRLYQDASRSDQLIRQVDPPNPCFMPIEFQALSA